MLAVFVVLLKDGYQFLVLLINVISFFCEEKKGGIFHAHILLRHNIFMHFNTSACRKRI